MTMDVLADLAGIAYLTAPGGVAALSVTDQLASFRADALALPIEATIEHGLTSAGGFGLNLLLEGLVLLPSAGLALLVAFRALYVDKAFGSWTDYVAVFALGVGAELLISGV